MPDISLCRSTSCSKRESCYRATATPSRWQSYFSPEATGEDCRYYMPPLAGVVATKARCPTEDHHDFDSSGQCRKCYGSRIPG